MSLLFFILGEPGHALTIEEERRLGERVFFEIEKSAEFVRDPLLLAFLNRLGNLLGSQVGPVPFQLRFYLLKAQEPNAFAIPGGHVFVSTGLLVMAEDEHEVAGVLSHEIAHVTSRHVADLLDRSKRLNLAAMAAAIAGLLLGGGKTSEAVATTAMATSQALVLKYTREHETEADQKALNTMIKAGYDPRGMIGFLNKIYRYGLTSSSKVPVYLLTHPAIESRISLLENLLQVDARAPAPRRTVENYPWIQARAFVEEREAQVAVSHFESMVKAHPNELKGLVGLGLAFRKMGRLDKSAEVLEQALSIAPGEISVLRELGVTCFFQGKLDQSIEIFEGLTSSGARPKDSGSMLDLYLLGRAYQEKGELSRAEPLLLRVRQGIPEFVDVYHNLGSIYGRTGDRGLSHLFFGRYFKMKADRKSALLHYRTALERLEKGRPEREEALRELKELTEPDS